MHRLVAMLELAGSSPYQHYDSSTWVTGWVDLEKGYLTWDVEIGKGLLPGHNLKLSGLPLPTEPVNKGGRTSSHFFAEFLEQMLEALYEFHVKRMFPDAELLGTLEADNRFWMNVWRARYEPPMGPLAHFIADGQGLFDRYLISFNGLLCHDWRCRLQLCGSCQSRCPGAAPVLFTTMVAKAIGTLLPEEMAARLISFDPSPDIPQWIAFDEDFFRGLVDVIKQEQDLANWLGLQESRGDKGYPVRCETGGDT